MLKNIGVVVAVAAALAATAKTSRAGTMGLVLEQWGGANQQYHAPAGETHVTLYQSLGTATGSSNVADAQHVDVSDGGSFEWQIANNSSGIPNSSFYDPFQVTSTNQLVTFCIEINQNINWQNNPAYQYNVISLADAPKGTTEQPVNSPGNDLASSQGMGQNAASLIEKLWAAHSKEVFGQSALQSGDPSNPSVLAGALQLAIWKIEYDHTSTQYTDNAGSPGGVDFSNGFLRVDDLAIDSQTGLPSDPIVATAQAWINGLSSFNGTPANLLALSSTSYQDQLVEVPITRFQTPVPEPASGVVWLVGGAIAGFVGLRRGKKVQVAV